MNPPVQPETLRIFIGYDPRQPVAYQVLAHSIIWRACKPVSIMPLVLETLPIQRMGLTPFTYTRFLVPWLCGFQGWALFMDLDMLLLDDIAGLFDLADDRYAAMVAKNPMQLEWASLILYNCGHPANRILTPDYVDDPARCVTPHVMDWLNPELVGDLPPEWNHTVGYDQPRADAKLVHFTQGAPLQPEIKGCEYSDQWMQALKDANSTQSWVRLMGRSVHAARLPDGRVLPRLHPEAVGKPG
jgi:hypothetical protein